MSDEEASPKDTGVEPTARWVAYKPLLVAVVIGVLALSMLWLFVIRQQGDQGDATLATNPDTSVYATPSANGLQISGMEEQIGKIDRGMASISDRIDQGFEAEQSQSVEVQNQLSEISRNIQTIEATIADQRETDQALGRQIDAGDRPAGLLLALFQKGDASPLGDGHIGAVIPEIDGIEIKGRPLDGTGFAPRCRFALGGF